MSVPPFGVSPLHSDLLPNGVQVLSEEIRGVRSVSVGVWVRQGAAHEGQVLPARVQGRDMG